MHLESNRASSTLDIPTITTTLDNRVTSVTMSNAEVASSYAALILADDGVEITVSASEGPRRRLEIRKPHDDHGDGGNRT